MNRRIKVGALIVVLGGLALLAAWQAYFYLVVLRPGVQKLVAAAERGDPEVQTQLGMLYEHPSKFYPAIRSDPSKAVFWYQKAANQGYAQAEVLLSLAYAGGKGVRQDDVQVFRWMRQAAEHGSAEGQMMLARMFAEGYNGVPRDDVQAARWYRAAAEQGQKAAQRFLGDCYATGTGVERDEIQAIAWFRKAAAQGDVPAQQYLRRKGAQDGVARKDSEASPATR